MHFGTTHLGFTPIPGCAEISIHKTSHYLSESRQPLRVFLQVTQINALRQRAQKRRSVLVIRCRQKC